MGVRALPVHDAADQRGLAGRVNVEGAFTPSHRSAAAFTLAADTPNTARISFCSGRRMSRRRSVRSVAGPTVSRVAGAMLRRMNRHRFVDKHLRCVSCGEIFILSAGEQELYSLRGVSLRTTFCPVCVRQRVYRSSPW